MARAARMALDAALLSIEKVRPLVSGLWGSAKNLIVKTPVKPLFHNPMVEKVEGALENLTDTVISKISAMRDRQLPGELRYLEKELEKTRRRMFASSSPSNQNQGNFASKTLKPELAIAWQYCKIECAPPMTVSFFAGRGGAKLEQIVGGAVNNFIGALESQIKKIDEQAARVKREKEEKIKAEQERIKAEELKKRQEAAKKAEEAKKLKEKEVAAKQAEAEAKKAAPEKKETAKPEVKKAEAAKPEVKKAEVKKPEGKRKPPAKKQPEAKKKSAAAAKKPPKKSAPKKPTKKDPKKKK